MLGMMPLSANEDWASLSMVSELDGLALVTVELRRRRIDSSGFLVNDGSVGIKLENICCDSPVPSGRIELTDVSWGRCIRSSRPSSGYKASCHCI
jgi:hypothetical protein